MKRTTYTRHAFNISPEINKTDLKKLEYSIRNNGFNSRFPILIYEDKILDGWIRYKICRHLGITPVFEELFCDDDEAIKQVQTGLYRRNLNRTQISSLDTKYNAFHQISRMTEGIEKDEIYGPLKRDEISAVQLAEKRMRKRYNMSSYGLEQNKYIEKCAQELTRAETRLIVIAQGSERPTPKNIFDQIHMSQINASVKSIIRTAIRAGIDVRSMVDAYDGQNSKLNYNLTTDDEIQKEFTNEVKQIESKIEIIK